MNVIKPGLAVYPNILSPNSVIVRDVTKLPSVQETWTRGIRLQGGYWLGRFRISGLPIGQLRQFYNAWLGNHFVEKTTGTTWEGMIYELTLVDKISRRRSIEDVSNQVRAAYREHILNGGLENDDGTNFDDWTSVINGSDTISIETTNRATGAQCVKMTYVNNGNTLIYQTISGLLPFTTYRLRFNSSASGGNDGRYRVYDVSNSADIIPLTGTGISTARWETFEVEFTTPAGCTSVRLDLYGPSSAGGVFFDDISIIRIERGKEYVGLTDAVSNAESIAVFGTKEIVLDDAYETRRTAVAARDQFSQLYPWPSVSRAQAQSTEPYLDVTVAGYIFTLKWLYYTVLSYGSDLAAGTLLSNILALAEYVAQFIIEANSTKFQLPIKLMTLREAINHILNAADNGASSPTPYRFYMKENRTAVYEPISNAPLFVIQDGQLSHANAPRTPITNPYMATPGVVRDLDDPTFAQRSNHFFADPRDFLLDEVIVGPQGIRWTQRDI